MVAYPATAILRTPEGPLPIFSLVHDWRDGVQPLGRKLTVCSGDRLHIISSVVVHELCSMRVLSSEIGWTGTADTGEVPDKLQALLGFNRTIGAKTQTAANLDVQYDAMQVALWLSGLTVPELNKIIASRVLMDLGAKILTETDLRRLGAGVGLNHTKFTEPQMRLWLYTVLACLTRLGRVEIPKGACTYKTTKIVLRNTYYRDLILWYLAAFGCRVSARCMPSRTQILVRTNRLAGLLGSFFSMGMRPALYELALLRKMVGKEFCVMAKDGQAHFTASVDNMWSGCVEEVEVKATPAQMRAVSFPELGDTIIETNMLRMTYDT